MVGDLQDLLRKRTDVNSKDKVEAVTTMEQAKCKSRSLLSCLIIYISVGMAREYAWVRKVEPWKW